VEKVKWEFPFLLYCKKDVEDCIYSMKQEIQEILPQFLVLYSPGMKSKTFTLLQSFC
uniref:Uncharacterized protein n=1 Tax=Prolemur simus TaxID=1328070 RepID=A0A8C9DHJ5_PROSS